jgi:hypothetical protein
MGGHGALVIGLRNPSVRLGWAGLGWAGLGWAGLGWAGLGFEACRRRGEGSFR